MKGEVKSFRAVPPTISVNVKKWAPVSLCSRPYTAAGTKRILSLIVRQEPSPPHHRLLLSGGSEPPCFSCHTAEVATFTGFSVASPIFGGNLLMRRRDFKISTSCRSLQALYIGRVVKVAQEAIPTKGTKTSRSFAFLNILSLSRPYP